MTPAAEASGRPRLPARAGARPLPAAPRTSSPSSAASAPPPPPSAAARHLEDARLRELAQAAASDESAARGRGITLLLVLGFVGAAGLAARPLYRAAFAERAAVEAAIQRAARGARREEGAERLQALLAALADFNAGRLPAAALMAAAATALRPPADELRAARLQPAAADLVAAFQAYMVPA